VQLPPLRQRVEDIRLLAEYFLQKVAAHKHIPRMRLSEEAVRCMEAYPWPGNVRELENTIQRATVLATSDVILLKDLPLGNELGGVESEAAAPPAAQAAEMTKESAIGFLLRLAEVDPNVQLLPWLEREFTLHAMKITKGNQVRAAKLLGITRATLRKRIEIFGITKELNIS
jgi:two-component system nitrogen regulation response regulator GlnG